jgi:alkylation response protein AidB-like acyl-CoA dehydrogenase
MSVSAFDDVAIQQVAQRLFGQHYEAAKPRLVRMGELAMGPVDTWAAVLDRNPPELVVRDRYGERIDEIRVHAAYRQSEAVAYGEGCVAASYDPAFQREHGGARHSLGLMLGYLYSQAESGIYCPLCMTDGAARLLEQYDGTGKLKERFIPRLAATDMSKLFTGAMFLTERQGGSDVGLNECRAVPDGDGFRLYGEKYFCSNAGADLIMVLARPDGAAAGTRGLGLYVMPRLTDDGKRNHYRYERLKDKFGTRSMATAEITLDGAFAWQLGEPGQGFKQMTEMLNLSRLYNSVASAAILSRSLREARTWCESRVSFGKPIAQHPMVADQLQALEAERQGAIAMVFGASQLLDKVDASKASDEEKALLRILLPLAKLHTAKQAVRGTSEAMELIGGAGYMEDWPLPRLLRDAQVLPIWEGCSNILALDALRAAAHGSEDALDALIGQSSGIKAAGDSPQLRVACTRAARLAQAALIERFGLDGNAAERLRRTPWGMYP